MRNYFIFLLLIVVSLMLSVSCEQRTKISGYIDGLGNDTILLVVGVLPDIYISDDEVSATYNDTIYSVNGRFEYYPKDQWSIILMNPKQGIYKRSGNNGEYYPESNSLTILWNSENNVEIKGKYIGDYAIDYVASGDQTNKSYSEVRSEILYLFQEKTDIEIELDAMMFGDNKQNGDEAIYALFDKRNQSSRAVQKRYMEFIEENSHSDLSAFYTMQIPFDKVLEYEGKLDKKVREGSYKPLIESRIKYYKDYLSVQENKSKIKIGEIAPDFTLSSIASKRVSLYSFDKEFIVLDFWGSWCGWCIVGFPTMREYYDKYRDRVEFIGVACRDSEEVWRETVKENNLYWTQLINERENDISVMYAIEGYPTKIILDKDKEIIGIFNGESEDFYNKLDEIMSFKR